MTDRHRQRCYDAEEAALGGTLLTEPQGFDVLVELVDAVGGHRWWAALGAPAPVVRRGRPGSRRSWSDGIGITIAPAGADALTVAHELAHHLTRRLDPADPGHGPTFRAAELRTVSVVGGTRAAELLAAELVRWGVAPGPWPGPEPGGGAGGLLEVVLSRRRLADLAAIPAVGRPGAGPARRPGAASRPRPAPPAPR
jgi:hypothetical protein